MDPMGGILAFLGLLISEQSRNRKANEYLAQKNKHVASQTKRKVEKRDLYNEDMRLYGSKLVSVWQEEGKYEYTPAEKKRIEKEVRERFDKLYKL